MTAPQHPIYTLKADFLRVLGHPKRVRILEMLQQGERAVGDLQAQLGLDSSGASQHLGALRRIGIVDGRREGSSVFYGVRDPRVFELLAVARAIVTSSIEHSHTLLEGMDDVDEVEPRQAAR